MVVVMMMVVAVLARLGYASHQEVGHTDTFFRQFTLSFGTSRMRVLTELIFFSSLQLLSTWCTFSLVVVVVVCRHDNNNRNDPCIPTQCLLASSFRPLSDASFPSADCFITLTKIGMPTHAGAFVNRHTQTFRLHFHSCRVTSNRYSTVAWQE